MTAYYRLTAILHTRYIDLDCVCGYMLHCTRARELRNDWFDYSILDRLGTLARRRRFDMNRYISKQVPACCCCCAAKTADSRVIVIVIILSILSIPKIPWSLVSHTILSWQTILWFYNIPMGNLLSRWCRRTSLAIIRTQT